MNTENTVVEAIHMVDLKSQYLRIKSALDSALLACVESTAFIKGPQVGQFEEALAAHLRVEEVVSCANGTDALQLAMMALGLKPGDEVIVPAFTYVATAEVIALLGLVPVLVDVDPRTFTLTAEGIRAALTTKTRAVVPVHLFGQCAAMEEIAQVCREHELFLIEDNAQSTGAVYTFSDGQSRAAGSLGHLGTTSFFPSKNLGCFGDGGAVYTNHTELADRVRMIANHGQTRKYLHEVVGINSRLDTIQAAILLEKLKHLADYTARRQWAAEGYDRALRDVEEIETPYRAPYSTHVFHQYTLKVPAGRRDALKAYLQQHGIPSMVYYPIPLSEQNAYRGLGRVAGSLAVTEDLCARVLSLPMHTELTEAQLAHITGRVLEFFGHKNPN